MGVQKRSGDLGRQHAPYAAKNFTWATSAITPSGRWTPSIALCSMTNCPAKSTLNARRSVRSPGASVASIAFVNSSQLARHASTPSGNSTTSFSASCAINGSQQRSTRAVTDITRTKKSSAKLGVFLTSTTRSPYPVVPLCGKTPPPPPSPPAGRLQLVQHAIQCCGEELACRVARARAYVLSCKSKGMRDCKPVRGMGRR